MFIPRQPSMPGPPHYPGFPITFRDITLGRASLGRGSSPSYRPLSDNTQHSKQTSIHASGGI